MLAVELIQVKWDGPYTLEEVVKDYCGPEDCGLYQIYGTHNVLGPEVLLYLGQTGKFSKRLSEHHEKWIKLESKGADVYLGRLGGSEMTEAEWQKRLTWAEDMLLYYCTPPYVSRGLTTIPLTPHRLLLNFGKRHRLPLALSSLWETQAELALGSDWKPFRQ